MSEAGWTADKPTVEGWYWIRDPRFVLSGGVKPVYITTKDLTMDWGSTAEFLGPITPESYIAGRVAGLREAVPLLRSVREWLKQLNDRFEAEWPNTARHTGLHIRQIDAWLHERQIEQQAQGGGEDGAASA